MNATITPLPAACGLDSIHLFSSTLTNIVMGDKSLSISFSWKGADNYHWSSDGWLSGPLMWQIREQADKLRVKR